MRQETPAVVAGNKAIRPSGECASTAVCAARNHGAGRSDRIGSWPPLSAHETPIRGWQHKTRALETVGGMDGSILGPCDYLDIFRAKDIEIASNDLTSILRTKSRTLR